VAARPRTRLAPAARREAILEVAGRLFSEHGYAAVSASEVARQAGVAPALVHHYFGGKRGLFLELVKRLGPVVDEVVRVDTTRPVRARTKMFAERWLGWIDANRQIWLATAGRDENIADPELWAAVNRVRERAIDSFIEDFPETLSEEPLIRLMLRSYLAFNRIVVRSWLNGTASQADAQRLLADTLHALITTVAPALKDTPRTTTRRRSSKAD
jgi:AcrR family transcriptional regulator